MIEIRNQKNIQECEYIFPYHYIPMWDGDRFSQSQTLNWGYEYLSYILFLIDKVNKIKFRSLLDVGCGDGRFLFEVNRRTSGKRLVGIDYFRSAINYAKIMAPGVEWICGDIKDKNLFDEEFDLITLIEVLEHVQPNELKQFLKGIHHYLKEDGNLIVTVPSNNVGVQKKHYQHFDLTSLKSILCPFFEVIDVNYLNRKLSRTQQNIKRLLSNRHFMLNSSKILGWLYKYYVNNLLLTDGNNCRRIAVTCKRCS